MQLGVIPGRPPEWRIEACVELVMDGEEIPDVIPGPRIVIIVKLDERRSGVALAVEERISEGAGLDADDLQRGGLERFDESDGVPNSNYILHPIALETSA